MKALLVSLVAAFSLAGCATTDLEKQPDFPTYFVQRTEGDARQAKLVGTRLYGPNMDVTIGDRMYRGVVRSQQVDLRLEGNKAAGSIGGAATELYVEPLEGAPDAFVVRGLFARSLGTLEVTPTRISGKVGRCGYELARESGAVWYSGRRNCAGERIGYSDIAFPTQLAEMPLPERGVLVALFLGGG